MYTYGISTSTVVGFYIGILSLGLFSECIMDLKINNVVTNLSRPACPQEIICYFYKIINGFTKKK